MKIGTLKRYRLTAGGKPMKDREPDILKKDFPFTEDYIALINSCTDHDCNGKFIEVDEEKTKEYHEAGKKRRAEVAKKKEMEQAIALSNISELAKAGAKTAASKAQNKD